MTFIRIVSIVFQMDILTSVRRLDATMEVVVVVAAIAAMTAVGFDANLFFLMSDRPEWFENGEFGIYELLLFGIMASQCWSRFASFGLID